MAKKPIPPKERPHKKNQRGRRDQRGRIIWGRDPLTGKPIYIDETDIILGGEPKPGEGQPKPGPTDIILGGEPKPGEGKPKPGPTDIYLAARKFSNRDRLSGLTPEAGTKSLLRALRNYMRIG
jgi:hypothetical protein